MEIQTETGIACGEGKESHESQICARADQTGVFIVKRERGKVKVKSDHENRGVKRREEERRKLRSPSWKRERREVEKRNE